MAKKQTTRMTATMTTMRTTMTMERSSPLDAEGVTTCVVLSSLQQYKLYPNCSCCSRWCASEIDLPIGSTIVHVHVQSVSIVGSLCRRRSKFVPVAYGMDQQRWLTGRMVTCYSK